ncbi:polysaccharide deacetylase family protein [Microbacteriaceae bacterium 4G12]
MRNITFSIILLVLLFGYTPQSAAKQEATLKWDPITYESSSTTIYTKNIKQPIISVRYNIWRTADGKKSMQSFTSTDKKNNFPFALQTKQFQSQRGEYQIEAIGMKKSGASSPLTKATVTFEQYVPILMYHSIAEFTGSGWKELYVTPFNFEQQMKYLKDNGYTMLTFERWKDINKVNKPIIATFDDGYKNNWNVFTIFQKLKDEHFQPAGTIFAISDFIGRKNRLSKEELKEMSDSGMFSIQSHSANHPDLRKITNYEYELKGAKEKIESITNKPVIALAYPYGFWNDAIVEETKKYYQFAVTIKPGLFIEKGLPNERYLLPRVTIAYSTTLETFARRISSPVPST